MKTLRIFIADDHKIMLDGLKVLIDAQPDMKVIGEADNGRTAWRMVRDLLPDVVVMDVSMPNLNGVKTTSLIMRVCKNVKVLALSAFDDKAYLRQLLEAGASGYVLKQAAADELIKAIRIVASGGVYLDPSLAGKIVDGYIGRNKLRGAKQNGTLTEREKEVLRLVALGYTNKEIASDLNISVKTVETHKTHIMEKLDIKSRADMVRYAIEQGWMQDK
jgi:DNA-binding NarL/FixJ family response regulator